MNQLTEGARLVYVLSEEDAENINTFVTQHPDWHPAGTHATAGQRVGATVVLSRGPGGKGEERLAVRLDGPRPEKAYHVAAEGLQQVGDAWRKSAGNE
jgi:hypothetical protein